jgi:MurNAc alpha-1-phosphate uridylyltransferase
MNAMILAAGRGERLRPLTDRLPKPLIEVRGQPLIAWHLHALRRAGIRSVVINLSWLGERIRDALGDGSAFGLEIRYSHEPEALETAGGIVQALPLLDEAFIVVNGDVFTDCDFSRLQLRGDEAARLLLVPNPPWHARGDFALNDGRLANEGEPRHTFSGIGVYRKHLFDGLPSGRRPLAPLLRAAAAEGRIGATLYRGLWSDVGTPERLAALQQAF